MEWRHPNTPGAPLAISLVRFLLEKEARHHIRNSWQLSRPPDFGIRWPGKRRMSSIAKPDAGVGASKAGQPQPNKLIPVLRRIRPPRLYVYFDAIIRPLCQWA